ncbi:DUF4350 domain-containing protein [Phenylobacterium sp.]|uniref:DUF4350 domain-containing protein n=1 Tax=Phenylobacterium sp. TaxID=1871053 RepID=UPI003568C324
MSATEAPAGPPQAFSPRTILALVIVGLMSFSALAVLAAYAPELRGATDPAAHALSASAVGFKGVTVMLKAEGAPVVISRTSPRGRRPDPALLVLTPTIETSAKDLAPFANQPSMLIVLPKWLAEPQPLHPGFVDKAGISENSNHATQMLSAYSPATEVGHRTGRSRPSLYGAGAVFAPGTFLRLDAIDGLQTISGSGWEPMLVDEQGSVVLARSKKHFEVVVLADPDLLNNQGLAGLGNARAGMAILNTLRDESGLRFDVTLNGYARGRGIGRMMLEPPWLAATLCGVAAALLMGLHGLARFGPTLARGRAIALGKRALVDNSAGLVRMAGREAELAPAYAALTKTMVGKVAGGGERTAAGGDNERWLTELARQRGAAAPADLTAQAERAKTADDLLAVGRSLYHWRLEITRERR